jgi:hypothetical protein
MATRTSPIIKERKFIVSTANSGKRQSARIFMFQNKKHDFGKYYGKRRSASCVRVWVLFGAESVRFLDVVWGRLHQSLDVVWGRLHQGLDVVWGRVHQSLDVVWGRVCQRQVIVSEPTNRINAHLVGCFL